MSIRAASARYAWERSAARGSRCEVVAAGPADRRVDAVASPGRGGDIIKLALEGVTVGFDGGYC
jgi:hypothetical protein